MTVTWARYVKARGYFLEAMESNPGFADFAGWRIIRKFLPETEAEFDALEGRRSTALLEPYAKENLPGRFTGLPDEAYDIQKLHARIDVLRRRNRELHARVLDLEDQLDPTMGRRWNIQVVR